MSRLPPLARTTSRPLRTLKRLLLAGSLAAWLAAMFLPSVRLEPHHDLVPGWTAFVSALVAGVLLIPSGLVVFLLAAIATLLLPLLVVAALREERTRGLAVVAGAGVVFAVVIRAGWMFEIGELGPGFWTWLGSLAAAFCGGVLSMVVGGDSRDD
jgi:hypothetical protein